MVLSVRPSRCDTVPRWLNRGMFNSVGWLPFLNCAPAFPAQTPSPTSNPKPHFHTLRIITLSPLQEKFTESRRTAPAQHPSTDRRFSRTGVSSDTHDCARRASQLRLNYGRFIERRPTPRCIPNAFHVGYFSALSGQRSRSGLKQAESEPRK